MKFVPLVVGVDDGMKVLPHQHITIHLYKEPAADITKKALTLLNESLDSKIRLAECVHDEFFWNLTNLRAEEAETHYLKKAPIVAELKGNMETLAGE